MQSFLGRATQIPAVLKKKEKEEKKRERLYSACFVCH